MSETRRRNFWDAYAEMLIRYRERFATIEKYLDSVLWLASYHYEEAEVEIELAQSGLSLVSYYHELLLVSRSQKSPASCSPLAILLNHISRFEVLLEILLARREIDPWKYILTLEAVKLCLRFNLAQNQKWSLFLEDEIEPSFTEEANENDQPTNDCTSSMSDKEDCHIMCKNQSVGEFMYNVRPFVYALSIMKWKKESWKSWTFSFIFEAVSLCLVVAAANSKASKLINQEKEKYEIQRRKKEFALYLLRSPFYERYTRNPLLCACDRFENLTQMQTIANIARSMVMTVNEYFFNLR